MRAPLDRSPGGPRRRRTWWFPWAAVLVGLSPLVMTELVLRALDLGRPRYEGDPFVGFSAVHPLFVLSQDGTRYEIARSRLDFFCPDWFSRVKGKNEFRAFCFGGSTVQGEPFRKQTSFTTWMELSLAAADPNRQWRVVNCGGISYASYRLVPIMEEVLNNYQPDLMIVYTGQNEFLEDRTYRQIKNLAPYLAGPCRMVARTRLFNVLSDAWWRLRGRPAAAPVEGRPILKDETDAMLEYRGGLDRYHRDDKWRRDVIMHFEYNLRRMVQLCREHRVPLILMNPVVNLRDCAPFKAEHRRGLTEEELARWKSLFLEAAQCQGKNIPRAIELLEEAKRIDDQHAGLHYALGKCYDMLGMMDKAKEEYILAKDNDICPLRILEPMSRIVLEVAADTKTPLLDVRKMFEDLSEDHLLGGYLLIDHVHPSIYGHQLIAEATVKLMQREGFLRIGPNWKQEQDRRFHEHFRSLPELYFSRGMEKAERLRCWTQGKGDSEPPKEWNGP